MLLAESSPDSQRQALARRYAKLSRWLSLTEVAIVGTLLLALLFSGLAVKLSHFLAFPQPWAAAIYLVILMFALGIILLPLSYYQGLVLPRRYGLSKQKARDWLVDGVKASALGLALGLLVVITVYWFLQHLPAMWWLCTSVFLFLLSLLLTRLTPNLLLPIFFRLEPLRDEELKQRLLGLALRARTKACGVFTMNLSSRGTTANAMLAGLGSAKRIILSDTLLQEYPPEEIEVVLAHELGHHLHRDIPKLIAVQTVLFLLAFYLADLVLRASLAPLELQGISDAATLPVLFLFLGAFGLASMPLANTYSRYLETAADRAALQLTGNPQAFISAMTRLTNQNLAEARPSRWVEFVLYDHPSYTKRVMLARRHNQHRF